MLPIKFMYYSSKEVPTEPLPDAITYVSSSLVNLEDFEAKLNVLFEKRPVWSLTAIKANLPIEASRHLQK